MNNNSGFIITIDKKKIYFSYMNTYVYATKKYKI